MTAPPPPALVINDGRLGGLVACWSEAVAGAGHPRSPHVAWFPAEDRRALASRRNAFDRQLDLCRVIGALEQDRPALATGASNGVPPLPDAGLRTTAMLLAAAVEALHRGCPRVVWPVHLGGPVTDPQLTHLDLSELADCCDRAMLVGELVSLDARRGGPGDIKRKGPRVSPVGSGVIVELPYAEFSDADLIDLALDLDAPLDACWWCDLDGPRLCGDCPECRRWAAAIRAISPDGHPPVHVPGPALPNRA